MRWLVIYLTWLVVEPYPSEKYEFVSWEDDIPNIWKVIIHSCSSHHQPVTAPYNPILPAVLGIKWNQTPLLGRSRPRSADPKMVLTVPVIIPAWIGCQWPFLGTDGLEVAIPYLVGGVYLTILKNDGVRQWEGLSHIFWKMKHVPNHQPDI